LSLVGDREPFDPAGSAHLPEGRSPDMRRSGFGAVMNKVWPGIALALLPAAAWAQEPGSTLVLPTIEVVGTSPVPGSELDRDKVPANVVTIGPSDFDHRKAATVLDAIQRGLPGVTLGDQTGNPFQLDVNYRGFVASPVIGTPQGLAVYQNGVRINEVFGDTVNWDFIPEMAINRLTLVPNNPVYGLNALGGAISIEMKNGFTYQGVEAELRGGSFGRRVASAQAGGQNGNLSAYVTADAINDDGWRDHSPSQLRRMYVDLGARNDQAEFHVAFTGASNKFGAVTAAPVQLLNQRWQTTYTWPQTTQNDLAFLTTSLNVKPTDTLSFQATAYYRGFWQHHFDANTTSAQICGDPTLLCLGDGTTPLLGNNGVQLANFLSPTGVLGEIDRTFTTANSFGGSAQATSTAKVVDHDNHVVVGASVDHGIVQFTGTSELGTIGSDLFVTGTGVIINQANAGGVGPVGLMSTTTYTGVYATDTFDVTDKLGVTVGGRFNVATIRLNDELGTALTNDNRYSRFNPVVGATYKLNPNVTIYGGYSEANRAPTPLELGCSNPQRPCLIDNFLVSDPPLKQVVSHTTEAGLRGAFDVGDNNGRLTWSFGVFHTANSDDIINVASPIPGHGFFQNGGNTLRQGVEASASYAWDKWSAYANYSFVDATFQSPLTLSSPNNPAADGNGNIFVSPGDHIPATPRHRFKAGAEYQITEAWKLGADLNVTGSQYLVGDQANQNPKVPAYWVVNLHTSYKVSKNVELFGLVQNLFNQRYYTFGTFFNTGQIPFLGLTDPRTFTPGMPLAAFAGIRATF
jgi:iron complex outermembrane receptor protein